MNDRLLILLASLLTGLFSSTAGAALSCALDGSAVGYYQCYEGRLSGFLQTTDGYWLMLNNPGVNDNLTMTGTVTLFPGDTSATKYVDPVLYARAGWLIDFTFSQMSFPMPTDAATQLNAAVWNIFEPGSVPLYTTNGDSYQINEAYQLDMAGAGDNWNVPDYIWMLTTGGNEALVLSRLSPVPPASTTPTPIPPAAWLFGSGLIGLATVARKRA